MPQLAQIWPIIESYIANGVNVIPVRERTDEFGKVKTPYGKWQHYQSTRITEAILFKEMEYRNTSAAAFVCGVISGNLFVIDIDCKYQPGFEAIYFKDIREMNPELWERLRIHRTTSGGYHIVYRLTSPPPGPAKLASRLPTEDEQQQYRISNPKAKQDLKSVCFLETRGEGSLASCEFNEGYSVHQNRPLPTLTEQEHEFLLHLGQTYNQIVKVDKPYTPPRTQQDYYDENPFEHFNGSEAAERVLADHGWKQIKESARFIWYSRPDAKDKDIHAAFNKERRMYKVFTTSSQFDTDKAYNPAGALALLQFNGDKKALYTHLVDKGYGKVKPKHERQRVQKLARAGAPLPENFSPAAKEEYVQVAAELAELHPYGVFWEFDPDEERLIISREALYGVAAELGFRLYKGQLVMLNDKRISQANERQFQDVLKAYIREIDPKEHEAIANCFEAFIERHGKFSISRMPMITEDAILKDDKDTCYKFFQNGVIKITSTDLTALFYTDLPADKFVLAEKIQPRDFALNENEDKGLYHRFLSLCTDWKTNQNHIKKVLGYLSHEYKDETTAYIIVLVEQCHNPKDGGGSGKNVFTNLLNKTTSLHTKNGAQVSEFNEKFFQSWSGQRLMCISDVPKNFQFNVLKEASSGVIEWKKLYKDPVEVSADLAPKLIVLTNFSYEVTDGGLKRRIIPIEFTDFFTKSGGIDTHFGVHFPAGWSAEDWNGYDTLIMECIQEWLQAGRKLTAAPLTESGMEKQFEHTYGIHLTSFIRDNFDAWKGLEGIPSSDVTALLKNYWIENDVPVKFKSSTTKFVAALKEYSHCRGYTCFSSKEIYYGPIKKRSFVFERKAPS